MAIATETDPVKLILEILEATTDPDYPKAGARPDRFAQSEEWSPAKKRDYEGVGVYVYAIGEIQMQPIDATGDKYSETAQVGADIWTLEGADHARAIAEDVREVINDHWTDNRTNTEWVTVRVTSENDYTHETFRENPGQHDRHLVTATLMRDADV